MAAERPIKSASAKCLSVEFDERACEVSVYLSDLDEIDCWVRDIRLAVARLNSKAEQKKDVKFYNQAIDLFDELRDRLNGCLTF